MIFCSNRIILHLYNVLECKLVLRNITFMILISPCYMDDLLMLFPLCKPISGTFNRHEDISSKKKTKSLEVINKWESHRIAGTIWSENCTNMTHHEELCKLKVYVMSMPFFVKVVHRKTKGGLLFLDIIMLCSCRKLKLNVISGS